MYSSEDDNPHFGKQYRQGCEAADECIPDNQRKTAEQDSEDHEEEGSFPASLQYRPFKCSLCSPACRELARSISRGESGWKEWYAKHPDLTMPAQYHETAPTAVSTEDQNKGDANTTPSGSHNSEDAHIYDIGPLRFEDSRIRLSRHHSKTEDKEEIKRPNTRGAKKENALATKEAQRQANKTEDGLAKATVMLLEED